MSVKKLFAVLLAVLTLLSCGIVFSVSANQREITANTGTSTIVSGDEVVTAAVGDTFVYSLYLCANEKFEDFQISFSYDDSVIKAVPYSDGQDDCFDIRYAPNLLWPVTNVKLDGRIKHNSSSVDGFDFSEENLLFTCEFRVVGTGTAHIKYNVEEMTILGNDSSYFAAGTQLITDGITFREEVTLKESATTVATEPSETLTTAVASEPAESQGTTAASEPAETTVPTADMTDAAENTTAVAPSSEAATVATTSATEDESSSATDSSEPYGEGLIGDANIDGKVNIKDVTLIQKHVANILSFTQEQSFLADTNRDEKVNIKDATAIQKFIAGLIKEF